VDHHRNQLIWFTEFCKKDLKEKAVDLMDEEMEKILQDVTRNRHISLKKYEAVMASAADNYREVVVPHWTACRWPEPLSTTSRNKWKLRGLSLVDLPELVGSGKGRGGKTPGAGENFVLDAGHRQFYGDGGDHEDGEDDYVGH